MKAGAITSQMFRSSNEFCLETYCLNKNTQLTTFLALPNEGKWLVKNTSYDKDKGSIQRINNVEKFKKSMLLKVRRGPREKLQAIIGTNQAKIDDFSDSEEEKVEPQATYS